MQQSAAPITYPEALRAVSKQDYQQPLTVAIGADADTGAEIRANLEEASASGIGPHLGILGPTGSGKTTLLLAMVRSILSAPPTRGVEVAIATAPWSAPDIDGVTSIDTNQTCDLQIHLESLIRARQTWQDRGLDGLPAAVVAIDDPAGLSGVQRLPSAVERALRVGRALDIHLVCASQGHRRGASGVQLTQFLSSWVELGQGPLTGGALGLPPVGSRLLRRTIRLPAPPQPGRSEETNGS